MNGSVDAAPSEPVTWVHARADGGRSFYTSLGHVDDFENPVFRRLLTNAIHWLLQSDPTDPASEKMLPDDSLERVSTTVFEKGEEGYHTYRIPAIVRTQTGILLAFAEARQEGGGDAGNIDLVLRRSSDNGKTWSKNIIVWNDGENTCGNPCPVVDQSTGTIWLPMTWNLGSDHESEIMAGTSKQMRLPYVTCSTDEGLTWSEPIDISGQVRNSAWRWYATGPGNAIQLSQGKHAGRLLIPANHSDHRDASTHPYRSHVFWSDDHGKTWELGGVQEPRTNESAVVELADGNILHSMRSYHGKQNRALSTSKDGGDSWMPVRLADDLPTPVCQGSILRLRWPNQEQETAGLLVHSSPTAKSRSVLELKLSRDEGKTWSDSRLVYDGPAAYSSLVKLDDHHVGVLFEKDNYQTIHWQILEIE